MRDPGKGTARQPPLQLIEPLPDGVNAVSGLHPDVLILAVKAENSIQVQGNGGAVFPETQQRRVCRCQTAQQGIYFRRLGRGADGHSHLRQRRVDLQLQLHGRPSLHVSAFSIAEKDAAVQRNGTDGNIDGINGKITVDIGMESDIINNRLDKQTFA